MENYYDLAERMKQHYDALQDEQSREIFWARLRYDMEPIMSNAVGLCQFTDSYTANEKAYLSSWKDIFSKLSAEGKKVILYGAGRYGQRTAVQIFRENCDFWGYCDGRTDGRTTLSVSGREKPMVGPDYLFEHMEDSYVVITTTDSYLEILALLHQHDFPEDHILPLFFDKCSKCDLTFYEKQYFEFPELYPQDTAFVDVGCFDGSNSIQFAKWCGGMYSQILAFEPDDKNYELCLSKFEEADIQNVTLFKMGLSNAAGTQLFSSGLNSGSFMIDSSQKAEPLNRSYMQTEVFDRIHTATLDEIAKDICVGFIKMDIEGAEFGALQGSSDVIRRDKPLLAISVYHCRGDILAIMDYLHELVPEYRFWVRHYGPLENETVLYAAM